VFDAWLPAKDCAQALDLLHADSLKHASSREIPLVGHGDDLDHARVFEDELDQPAHGRRAEAVPLRVARHTEANLGPPLIRVDANAHVTNQFVRRTAGEPELNPGSARKQVYPAHLLNESTGLAVCLRFPSLIPADDRIVPVGLKPTEVGEFKPPQYDSAKGARKGFQHVDSPDTSRFYGDLTVLIRRRTLITVNGWLDSPSAADVNSRVVAVWRVRRQAAEDCVRLCPNELDQ
jgi:hypothetical protein